MPTPMRADIERWIEDYPKASAFIGELYAAERGKGTMAGKAGQMNESGVRPETGAERCNE